MYLFIAVYSRAADSTRYTVFNCKLTLFAITARQLRRIRAVRHQKRCVLLAFSPHVQCGRRCDMSAAWIDATLHAVGRILRRRRFTAAVALLGSIALIALSIVPDAVCIELKSDDAASTRGDGADLESSTSRVCLDGGRLPSDPALVALSPSPSLA